VAKYDITVAADNCTGCLRCELACSDAYAKTFSTASARIRVVMTGPDCEISFTDECVECGICADNCLYDTLSKERKEGDR